MNAVSPLLWFAHASRFVRIAQIQPVRMTTPALAALALAAALSPMARAGIVNVQFGCTAGSLCNGAGGSSIPQTGAAMIGAPGDVWNMVSGDSGLGATGSNVPLVDAAGAATPVSVSWTSLLEWVTIPSQAGGFASTSDANLIAPYLVSKNGLDTIQINGLQVGGNYSLYLYTQAGEFSGGRETEFIVNGGPPVITAPMDANAGTFINGQNYVMFNVTPDALGTITVQYGSANGEADVNGFQLITPEPNGGCLGVAGLAALIGFGRRRVRR